MKLLGVRIKLNKDKLEIDLARVDIEQETKKLYRLLETNRSFDYLRTINKDDIGAIRSYHSLHSLENVIFVLDRGTKEQEQELKNKLINDMVKELGNRQYLINKMISVLGE